MQTLTAWAHRWQVPPAALQDLLYTLGLSAPASVPPPPGSSTGEASVQAAVRLEHARRTGGRLFRNNVGIAYDNRGVPVRFGLANDSAQANKIIKSSDLIGETPLVVTQAMVGHTVGVFTAFEIKRLGWKYQGDRPCICKPRKPLCQPCHERAQLAFGKLVVSLGGYFKFVQSVEDL